jgi:hypothetical protein
MKNDATQKKIRRINLGRVLGLLPVFCVFAMIELGFAAEIKIAWDPNTEEDLAGYKVY